MMVRINLKEGYQVFPVVYSSTPSFTKPENRGTVVCRALTNRTETPFLAQLLSLKYSGPLKTSLQAFLIVG